MKEPCFKRLLDTLPDNLSVLDIGYGGLDGENTTEFLRAKYKDITGVNNNTPYVERYREVFGGDDPVRNQDYWDGVEGQWDLVVSDLNIEGNLRTWSKEGLKYALRNVRRGGYFVTYIMGTDDYGDDNSKKLLKKHRKEWWGKVDLDNLPHLTVLFKEQEERRPEITWVLFKYE